MEWDLGLYGLGVLAAMSIGFGLVAAVIFWRAATRWMFVIAAATYSIAGLIISEVIYGWATEADLQPNIDGLSFDEVLLFGLLPGIAVVLLTWYLTRTRHAMSA
jgi:hypothetical protein